MFKFASMALVVATAFAETQSCDIHDPNCDPPKPKNCCDESPIDTVQCKGCSTLPSCCKLFPVPLDCGGCD